MTNTSLAHPAPRSTRETPTRKALRLYPTRTVEPLGHGRYSVEGTEETYTVDLAPFGGVESCDCPATKPCYHLGLAAIHRAKYAARMRRESEAKREARKSLRGNLAPLGVS